MEYCLNRVRIRRPAALNSGNVTLGDISVLCVVLTFCKTSNLKVRQEFSAKQTLSPNGQRLQREQFDEAVSCVTIMHGFNGIISDNLCVVLYSAFYTPLT